MTITANYFGRMIRPPAAVPKSVGDVELQSLNLSKNGEPPTQKCCALGSLPVEDWLSSKRSYEELNKKNQLISASSPSPASSPTPTASPAKYLTRNQALGLLSNIRTALHAELNNQHIDATLSQLIGALLRLPGEQLTLEIWAAMSLALEQLSVQSLPDYTRINLRYLELVSRNSWAQLSHDHLVAYFARDIERVSVDNPAMQDTSSGRVGLEVTTPLKMLSAGGELRYQQITAVDDEGNYVTSRQVSGSVTCSLKALFASLKTKVTGTAGAYIYGKTAQDYVRHMFVELVADNRNVPELSRYITRAAAAGQSGLDLDEISDFENLNNAYLLQQDAISRSFSLLLNLPAARPDSTGKAPASAVNLQAVALSKARITQGLTTGKTVGAQGSVGFSMLQAGLKAEATSKNVYTGREATLCELLQNPYTDDAFKAGMKQDIVLASAKIKNRVLAFWYGDNAPDNAHELHAAHISHFTQDWNHYRHLHAMHWQGHATTGACIAAFHKKYGARNARECLCAMALLLADIYARLQDSHDCVEHDQLKSAVQKLEQELHQSSIPNARTILAQHAVARQRIEYSSNEKIVQFSAGYSAQPDAGNPGVKISFRTLHHYNALRCGDEVTLEITTGDSIEQNRQLLKSIREYFQAGTTGLHTNFGIDTFSSQGVTIVRYFKPKIFVGLPYAKLFERRVVQTNRQFGTDASIPLAGALGLRASLGCTQTGSKLISETPGSQTMLYFAKHYLHALSSGKADRNGKALQDSYWHRMERQHGKSLEKMLVNMARHSRRKTGLSLELDAIERALLLSKSEQQTGTASRHKMRALAQQLERARTPENYHAALAGFKEYMAVIFPYWQRDKENSSAYKKWRYKV